MTARPAAEYDVFLSFTRSDAEMPEVLRLEAALKAAGLRVFRDSVCVGEFDGITAEITKALATSKILLAYYTIRYPTRSACQWELTAAFLAAQRDGDPRRRILAINPEPTTSHLVPVELAGARFGVRPTGRAGWSELARRVREKVDAVSGPLGELGHGRSMRLPTQVQRPRRFVGRFGELWQVHNALRAADFPLTERARPCSAAVVTGLAGIGKTSLVGQYAFLFRDAYPGGIHWTGPLDNRPDTLADQQVMGRYFAELREVATALKLGVAGVEQARLPAILADHFDELSDPVLWVVDDVPTGMAPELLDRLLIPSPAVRTVLTSRAAAPGWDAVAIELGGLPAAEARRLFDGITQPVDRLINRSAGHPMLLRSAADRLRSGRGIVTVADVPGPIDSAPQPAIAAIEADLDQLGDTSRRILELAAVLAMDPIPPDLIVELVAPSLPIALTDARRIIGAALNGLADRGLAAPAPTPRHAGCWQIHALAVDVVRRRMPGNDTSRLARAVASAVLRRLAGNRCVDLHLLQHGRALAERHELPEPMRVDLLRHLARLSEELGDLDAAATMLDAVLGANPSGVDDLLSAASVKIAAGRYQEALGHARTVLDLATAGESEYRARLLVARALDCHGRYRAADDVFWNQWDLPGSVQPPSWLPPDERLSMLVARAVALRQRGSPKQALELLVDALSGWPGADEDLLLSAKVELARLQLLTGLVQAARTTARETATAYRARGMDNHVHRLAALGILADAELALHLPELRAPTAQWEQAEKKLRELRARYEREHNEHNPLTLTAAVQHGSALVSLRKPRQALAELTKTEQQIVRLLGEQHPLRYRALHQIGLAHSLLLEFGRYRTIMEELHPKEVAALGANHQDTLATQLELGIALAVTGDPEKGRHHIDEATANLRRTVGWNIETQARAIVGQLLARLPPSAQKASMMIFQLQNGKLEPAALLDELLTGRLDTAALLNQLFTPETNQRLTGWLGRIFPPDKPKANSPE